MVSSVAGKDITYYFSPSVTCCRVQVPFFYLENIKVIEKKLFDLNGKISELWHKEKKDRFR